MLAVAADLGSGLATVIFVGWGRGVGGVPPSGVRAEGVGFAVEALQGLHGGRDQEVIGELR